MRALRNAKGMSLNVPDVAGRRAAFALDLRYGIRRHPGAREGGSIASLGRASSPTPPAPRSRLLATGSRLSSRRGGNRLAEPVGIAAGAIAAGAVTVGTAYPRRNKAPLEDEAERALPGHI